MYIKILKLSYNISISYQYLLSGNCYTKQRPWLTLILNLITIIIIIIYTTFLFLLLIFLDISFLTKLLFPFHKLYSHLLLHLSSYIINRKCCRRCPWSHGLRQKSLTLVWRWHQLLSGSLPNGRLTPVSRRF